jgi:2-amino-4-hydroxy-6-hydroxymethyldihydropteridine diphosphokinase
MRNILVALGANLPGTEGEPADTLRAALRAMPGMGIRVVRCAPFYSTPALARYEQPDYVNSVAVVETAMPPEDLLAVLHRIEGQFGRVRRGRWAPRVLDLDLIDYQGLVTPGRGGGRGEVSGFAGMPLALPHPGVGVRGFVLVPLRDVVPDWHHPVTGESVDELIARLPAEELAEIRRFED